MQQPSLILCVREQILNCCSWIPGCRYALHFQTRYRHKNCCFKNRRPKPDWPWSQCLTLQVISPRPTTTSCPPVLFRRQPAEQKESRPLAVGRWEGSQPSGLGPGSGTSSRRGGGWPGGRMLSDTENRSRCLFLSWQRSALSSPQSAAADLRSLCSLLVESFGTCCLFPREVDYVAVPRGGSHFSTDVLTPRCAAQDLLCLAIDIYVCVC